MKINKHSLLAALCLASLFYTSCSKKDTQIDKTIAPACTTNLAPANGSNASTQTVVLSWAAATDATSYDVYLGTTTNPTTKIASDVVGTTYSYTLTSTNTATYYWYVIPKNKKGGATGCQSSITSFNFSVILGCSLNIVPSNNSFTTSNSVTLTWTSVAGATGYDIYLGTTNNPTTVVAANVNGTNYTYAVPATSISTTYYWYVVPKSSISSSVNCSSTVTSFTYAVIKAPSAFSFPIVAYMPAWRSMASMSDDKFKRTTIVVYAFYEVNASGTLSAPASQASSLSAVATRAKANNSKIFLGINDGTGDGRTNFKNMASTASGRNNFIKSIMIVVRANNLDGVDMDWEYPTTSDGTDVTFTALMKELSDTLHRDGRYYLTSAITSGKYAGGYRDAIKNEVFPYVDLFNVMIYDDVDPHSSYGFYKISLNYWMNTRSMPKEKIVAGMPCYGKRSGYTTLTYNYIINNGGLPSKDTATVTYNNSTYLIYYDGMETVKNKTLYAKDTAKVNGVMFWEMTQDAVDDSKSLIKSAFDAIGRAL